MAKIRDSAATILASATSAPCEMPTHQAGDVLLAFVGKSGTAVVNTPAGWSATAAVGASTGAYGGVWTIRASTANTTVTFTTATAGAWVISIISVQGTFGTAANGSDALSVAANLGATDSAAPYVGNSITPAHTNSLVFSGIFSNTTYGLQANPGWVNLFTGDNGVNGLGVAYTVEDASSVAVASPQWLPGTGALSDTRVSMIAIRDSGALSTLECYVDRTTVPSFLLANLLGNPIGDVNSVAYIAANAGVLTSVLVGGTTSKTSTRLAVSSVGDAGYNPYRSVAQTAGSSSTTNLGHTEFTGTFNMTQGAGLFFGTYRTALPRDYIDLGKPSQGGIHINFTNGSTAQARAWTVGGQFTATTKVADYNPFVIQVQQTSNTAYAFNGTVTWNAVSRVSIGSSSYYGAAAIQWSNFYMLNRAILVGGTPLNPFTIADTVRVINNGSGLIPVASLTGSTLTSYMPIQYGGVDRCNVLYNLATIQFPKKADNVDYIDFHVDNNFVGVEIYGLGANDSFIFKNTVFTSESPYYWRLNAATSALSTYDFTGSSIINSGIVTLRSVATFNDMSFIGCPDVIQNGATITNSTFDNSLLESNAPSAVSNCVFISDGIGHGIEITTGTSHTLTRITFTGYGTGTTGSPVTTTNTGNEAVFVNIASGTVTLNIVDGTLPTVRSAGALVNVLSSALVNITGLKAGSEVRAYVGTNPATSVEIDGVESSGTVFTFSQSFNGEQGYITIIALGYVALYIPITYGASDVDIPIQQNVDRVYNNP